MNNVLRIDWVLSGDDGEETHYHRVADDLSELELDDPKKDEIWLDKGREWPKGEVEQP